MLNTLAKLFFWGYALMLLGVGFSGMWVAGWELPLLFGVPLEALNDLQRATLLNQYRFLKALEFGFGVFCLLYRREIFQRGRDHAVFLAGLGAGVAARAGGCLADGLPSPMFIAFMLLEGITGLLVWSVVKPRN